MAVFSPLQFFIFPFLFFVALPLALCAGFTTILAFMLLFLRLFLVYFNVGIETLRYVLVGHAARTRYIANRHTPSGSPSHSSESSPPSSPEARHRRRRSKLQGSYSSGSTTPQNGFGSLGLTPTSGLERDFEGVGGWRLDSIGVGADDADDQQWYNLNSRLELPDRQHHFRSHSGGVVSLGNNGLGLYIKGANAPTVYGPEGIKLHASPNSSRPRTPTNSRARSFTKLDDGEYFPKLEGKHARTSRC
ncbi:uncharacterized protein F4812DRAFT_115748 [Daldinia caldariorum]|uniref:uncharacterized protein n=1 Tax=Daldinia caldariorum TaxID=326644 RepID=UPI0020078D0C|nr:uncharacterized protein F4812DRAFT_115748 [Daldinia caldariorum]KAI1465884.1 hypothetical protein F4812DRAFT_115748 [Daldinia caldariorum]